MISSPKLPLEKPDFRREFRIGLVVYGGVSLAIYMNGVCREFYNAVRGRGIYKLIKALTDSDIIVDVISGTSAGGINGVLLSYALTNSDQKTVVDFKNFAEIWRESGDIDRLLRQPNQKEANSVLDGEGYYQDRLAEAFQKAWEQRISAPSKSDRFEDEWFSESDELDLFVTGTDVLGKVYQAFDNTGRIIEVKDHRTVFLLKHRQGRKHPFKPSSVNQQSLAKLCRITSCFPVAFPVVSVELPSPSNRASSMEGTEIGKTDQQFGNSETKEITEIDQRLVRWGVLANRALPQQKPATGYQLHFVDGGVLDNRPFSYAIEQINQRTAYRPVNRRLFYIDPSPDHFMGSLKFNEMAKPSIWKSAWDSLVSMPRYESIANDLNEIKSRNGKVRRYKFLRSTAERIAEQANDQPKPSELQPRSNHSEPTPEEIYLRCRLVGLRDRVLPLILRIEQIGSFGFDQQNDSQLNQRDLLEKTAEFITQYVADPEQQKERDHFLHQLSIEIRNLDVDYAMRKHFFLLEKLCQWIDDPYYRQDHILLSHLAKQIKAQIELLIVIKAGLEEMLRSDVVSDTFYRLIQQAKTRKEARGAIYQYLLRLHRFFLDGNHLPDFDPESDREFLKISDVDRPEDAQPAAKVSSDFFKALPGSLFPEPQSDDSSTTDQISARISGVLAQLSKKNQQLQNHPGRLDQTQPDSIWGSQYDFDGQENESLSILSRVEKASEQLIQDSGLTTFVEIKPARDKLLILFKRFRNIDQSVYAYEYLSDVQAKEQIEIVRISPQDAQLGFSDHKPETKLAGDQLGAFGGFFKKTWRSNDILWGRLDGLNRIVEAVITPESLAYFSHFLDRQLKQESNKEQARAEYIHQLVEESLSEATPIEKEEIKQTLEKSARGEIPQGDDKTKQGLPHFQKILVTAAHREILKSDLGKVLEDSIADQLTWSQQLVPPELGNLGYQKIKISSLSNPQLKSLQEVNKLLARLLKPDTRQDIGNHLVNQSKGQTPKIYWSQTFMEAFPKSNTIDRQGLVQYLEGFINTSRVLIHDLSGFLNQLSKVGQAEIQAGNSASSTEAIVLQSMNDQLSKVAQRLESIKPKYSVTAGYLDQSVTPFAVNELVKTPIQELLHDQEKLEQYFRNQYQVGSEKLKENIPPIILEAVSARAGLVLRNVLESPPTGQYLRNSSIFQFVNRMLQAFYWWVQARNPKTSLLPASLRLLPALLLPIAAILGIWILVSQFPAWLLVPIVTLVILGALNKVTLRAKLPTWTAWLLVVIAVILLILGPHFFPSGNMELPIPFNKLHISIQNP